MYVSISITYMSIVTKLFSSVLHYVDHALGFRTSDQCSTGSSRGRLSTGLTLCDYVGDILAVSPRLLRECYN